jgi:hypothetical protein
MSDEAEALRAEYLKWKSLVMNGGDEEPAKAAEEKLRVLYTATGRDLKALEAWLREVDMKCWVGYSGL